MPNCPGAGSAQAAGLSTKSCARVDALAVGILQEQRLAFHPVHARVLEDEREEIVLRPGDGNQRAARVAQEARDRPVAEERAGDLARRPRRHVVEARHEDERLRVRGERLLRRAVEDVVGRPAAGARVAAAPQGLFLLPREGRGEIEPVPLPLREIDVQRVVPRVAERRPPDGEAVVELRERPQRLRDGRAARVSGVGRPEPARRREGESIRDVRSVRSAGLFRSRPSCWNSRQRRRVVADEIVRLEPDAAVAEVGHFGDHVLEAARVEC